MDTPKELIRPEHVAIIMDGNGRWARRRGLPRAAGHRRGVDALKTAVRYCKDEGIAMLTVYAFSTENWQRPPDEVKFLMELLKRTFLTEIDELRREGARIRLFGDRSGLRRDVLEVWDQAELSTRHNSTVHLNVAFNYGGRRELILAARALAAAVKQGDLQLQDIDESALGARLLTPDVPDPDLLIRTGGEKRISNFLLWQLAYTEFYFTETLWPDFSREHFAAAVAEYAHRTRRFGGL